MLDGCVSFSLRREDEFLHNASHLSRIIALRRPEFANPIRSIPPVPGTGLTIQLHGTLSQGSQK